MALFVAVRTYLSPERRLVDGYTADVTDDFRRLYPSQGLGGSYNSSRSRFDETAIRVGTS